MKRYLVRSAAMVVATLIIGVVAYAQNGKFNTGGKNAPSCTVIGNTLSCSGKVSGLGGTTFEITVEAQANIEVDCRNPGGNVAPGQATTATATGSSGPIATPKNGSFNFTVETDEVSAPASSCHAHWTAEVASVTFGPATLTLFEDGVEVDTFVVP